MWIRYAPWVAFGCTIIALIIALGIWSKVVPRAENTNTQPLAPSEDDPVVVLAAPAIRSALEPAIAQFRDEMGIEIEVRYAASEALLAQLKLSEKGDLFIPADDSYVRSAREAGLVEQHYAVARMTAVAVVSKDHPQADKLTWEIFLRPGARLVQPSPEITAVGKLTREGLQQCGMWASVEAAKPTTVGTVTEAANAVSLGSADGAIVWDVTAKQFPKLHAARLPHLESITANVTAAVCKKANNRMQARLLAEYLADADTGRKHFEAKGYSAPKITDRPIGEESRKEITLYAGAMLRPAIEDTIREFEEREGVRVNRVYNGCGILVGQMRTGKVPDVFLACDPRFMGDVAEKFGVPKVISNNQLVIAVPKGNPHGLKELKDLGKAGLRVGVGHEQQCALGTITKDTFIQSGTYAAVRRNVKVEAPTGDFLVNQLLTGALDAVVCYITNVTPNIEKLDAISLVGIPCSAPEQPIAVALGSTSPNLAAKLIAAIESAESKSRFEQIGFGWGKKGQKK